MARTDKPKIDPLNVPAERKPEGHNAVSNGRTCGAKKKNGIACKSPAGFGTDHPGYGKCKFHWGATEAGRKSAARQQAAMLIRFYGGPLDTSPTEALLDEVRRTAGHVAFLGEKVSSWQTDLGPEDEIPIALRGWLDLYQTERAHLARVAKAALDAGVNERLVQLAEAQGARLATAIENILDALSLTPQQRALVPTVVPNALRGLTPPKLIEGQVEGEPDRS